MVSTVQGSGSSAPPRYVETRKRVRRVQKMKIDLARLEKYFGMPLYEAAEKLGVSTTTVKKKCRELGVKSWPRAARGKTEKDDKDETISLDQQQHTANRSSRQSQSPEEESESEDTSNTSVPMGGNSGTSSGVSVGSQSPSGGGSSNGGSDNSGGGGSAHQSGVGGSDNDNSRTTLDARTWSQDSSSTSKQGTWNATQLSFGLAGHQQTLFGYSAENTNNAGQIQNGGFSGDISSLYSVPLASQRGFVNTQSQQPPFSAPMPSQNAPPQMSMAGHSPAQFSNNPPAVFSPQFGTHQAPSATQSFSVAVPSSQPTPKDQAAANVSQEAHNLQVLQQQTQLQMMKLQRAELELRIQSLQQSLGSSAPVAQLPSASSSFNWQS